MRMSSGRLERAAFAVIKSAAHLIEAVDIDSGDAFEAADAVQHDALRESDMWLLLDERRRISPAWERRSCP